MGTYRYSNQINFRAIGFYIILLGFFVSTAPLIRIPGINFTLTDVLFLIGFILLYLNRNSRVSFSKPMKLPFFLWFLGVFLLIFGLGFSTIINGDGLRGIVVIIQYLYAYLFVTYVIFSLNEEELSKATKFYILGLCLASFISIIFYFFFKEIGTNLGFITGGGRVSALTGNSNAFTRIISFGILISLYSIIKNQIRKKYAVFMFLTLIGGLLLSGSFSGLFAIILSIVIFLIFSLKLKILLRGIIFTAIISSLFILIFGIPEVVKERIMPLFYVNSYYDLMQIGNFGIRAILLKEAWYTLGDFSVIGAGADSFREMNDYGLSAHNTFLLVWIEGGLFSLFGLILIIFSIIIAALQAWAVKQSRIVGSIAIAMVTMLLIFCFTGNHIYARHLLIPIILMMRNLNFEFYRSGDVRFKIKE